MKLNIQRYANELLFQAAIAAPHEVSEAQFCDIISLLTETKLTLEERGDICRFMEEACEAAASVDPKASDVSAIYKASYVSAVLKGLPVYVEG